MSTQILERLEADSSCYRKHKKTMTDAVFLAAAGRCEVFILQALWNRKSQMKQTGCMTPGVVDAVLRRVHSRLPRDAR